MDAYEVGLVLHSARTVEALSSLHIDGKIYMCEDRSFPHVHINMTISRIEYEHAISKDS